MNRLADQMSPYLLQHAQNPVNWWPWGPDAFAEARRLDRPVLLSIGYASCHWCHVMAHESFEDPAIGQLINERFVAIKVDREEHPDVDAVYMRAAQALTGSGGWPLTVFCDAAGRPFQAGTYYPPRDALGMPSFTRLLLGISGVWQQERARVVAVAEKVTEAVRTMDAAAPKPIIMTDQKVLGALQAEQEHDWPSVASRASQRLTATFDPVHGGFGSAPKFPPHMVLEFLIRHHARTKDPTALSIAERTCEAMARGGLFDQLGGGFARYSVDAEWVVPHFEKMLYDNALLARAYLHLWRSTGSALAERVARQTCDFLLEEMRTPEGGFASGLDADSDPILPGQHREGAYYAWSPQQLREVLGNEAEEAATWLAVTPGGSFERGTSVLQLPSDPPESWPSIRTRLHTARSERPAPARDDKVLAGWNGLAIAALAECGVLLGEPRYLLAARDCAVLLQRVHLREGRLLRVSRGGTAGTVAAVLEDYGGLAEGLLALYQATGELEWLQEASSLVDVAVAQFTDGAGGYYVTAADTELLLSRPREATDNAVPSGWSLLTGAMVALAALSGDLSLREQAERSMERLLAYPADAEPHFFGWGLSVLEAMLAGPLEVAIVGAPGGLLHRTAMAGTSPGTVVAVGPPESDQPALLAGRTMLLEQPAAYVCRNFSCNLPTSDPAVLADQVRARP